jgi:hypothetical protein
MARGVDRLGVDFLRGLKVHGVVRPSRLALLTPQGGARQLSQVVPSSSSQLVATRVGKMRRCLERSAYGN